MIDFSKLGKVKLGEIPPPPVEPQGTYTGTVRSWKWAESRWKNKETGQTEAQVHFTIKPTAFGEDVDEAEREVFESGAKLSDKIHIAEVGVQSGAQVYYMQELLRGLGIDIAGKDLDEALPNVVGASVQYNVVHRDGERGTIVNIRKLRPLIA
jgi:hypothetical protein